MFLSEKRIKKMMKEEYKKGGLLVGNVDGRLYIGGTQWEMEFEKRFVTNGILGMVVDMARELPELNSMYMLMRGNYVQQEILRSMTFPVTYIPVQITPVLQEEEGLYRVLQGDHITVRAKESLIQLIDRGELITKLNENEPLGPFYADNKLYWKNNTGMLRINCTDTECGSDAWIFDELSSIDIRRHQEDE